MVPPVALDVDGTLTRPEGGVDPQIFEVISEWDAPVVIATGRAFPYPVALCDFLAIDTLVVAENGGVVATDDHVAILGDGDAPHRVVSEFRADGYDTGRGEADLLNRWRETEVSVSTDSAHGPLADIADRHGMAVVDTGYAYHVKSPSVTKGRGLAHLADRLGLDPAEFVAVGDSVNDVELFETAGRSFAVANCDDPARGSATAVTTASYASGALEALETVRSESEEL